MKKYLLGAIIAVVIVFGYQYIKKQQQADSEIKVASQLIQEQVKNVGKLVVTEGNFAQVWSYKDHKKFYIDVLSARKKALIVVNAKVTVAYDLRQLTTDIDEESKQVIITNIPKPELNIYPDIEFYDVTQDYLNQFKASDYNNIKKRATKAIRKKIEKSSIIDNAQNRLISELSQIYVVTKTMGWTLVYNSKTITGTTDLKLLKN
ncbi:DUF4230 domain-containing protein [Zunongwangia sp.]|uniref:DUF4230 domain-containing protein n=1 Tax=Zunongwangia sp. TaxID=1965325 RepID=UPI003AA9BD15